MRRTDGVANYDPDLLPLPPNPLEGVLPVVPSERDIPDKQPRTNATTAASAASVRAITSQAIAFYFRAPAKSFFRTRVDYLAYARSVHQTRTELLLASRLASGGAAAAAAAAASSATWSGKVRGWLGATTPGVLTSAVKHHGWGVIPEQVLPPLVANVGVAAVLYTSYLQILGALHEESAKSSKRVVVAAPLDAIQARYDHRDLLASGKDGGKPASMWAFSAAKLREIGARGIFAGWGLTFVKDSFGSAVFFSAFEYVKAQSYYKFVRWYYEGLDEDIIDTLARKRPHDGDGGGGGLRIIRPHYAIEPLFLLLAGVGASFAQQIVLHPLNHIQIEHWNHLEDIDEKAQRLRGQPRTGSLLSRLRSRMFRSYYRAYQETWAQCRAEAAAEGSKSVGRWLYRGFWWNTIRQVPSTSAGLIIFELVRKKYGLTREEVRITKDGYDILLP
ncbi:unnamed protein product [Parascedosporium putredinis]|uniref:Mitochondrial carrier protein n=1 Tax=Parascedosporium putredinis TaxID=1442378 RepID=A0A9P1H0W3_9PEZI|nr:unnamed protein product [Parascedosporium putredinis]CAI7992171.1 unnamed protein product [Parascedosporium putredinis]